MAEIAARHRAVYELEHDTPEWDSANSRFHAHSYSDVPWLLQEVERLQAELETRAAEAQAFERLIRQHDALDLREAPQSDNIELYHGNERYDSAPTFAEILSRNLVDLDSVDVTIAEKYPDSGAAERVKAKAARTIKATSAGAES